MEAFLKPTYFIDCDDPKIIAVAKNLTRGHINEKDAVVTLFRFARDEIQYNPYGSVYEQSRYKASKVLERQNGYCIQKATLLAALLRAISVPAGLVFCDIRNPLIPQKLRDTMLSETFIFHCYNTIFMDGVWRNTVCAFDRNTCDRLNIPPVEFNGVEDALFPLQTADGRQFITYLNHRGTYDDVPFEHIIKEFRSFYGEAVLEDFANSL